MRFYLVAVGRRMPEWVSAGCSEFARRLSGQCPLGLIEVAAVKRTPGADAQRVVTREGERLLAAVPKGCLLVAMDERGVAWSTRELAVQMQYWMRQGRDVAFLVGGPDGLSRPCIESAHQRWSLSNLTLPHTLVRVVLAEQIYRAWTICSRHPYHRD